MTAGARLTPAAARRGVLAAQGFGAPAAVPDRRALAATVRRLAVVQIDSVNVVSRAHYLPLFSRLGPYDRADLDSLSQRAPRRLFEYWGHEASLLPVELFPLLRWKMATEHAWGGVSERARQDPGLLDEVLACVADIGPAPAVRIESVLQHAAARPRDHWGWNWSRVKHALEHLFWTGQVSAAGRDAQFRRQYALTERVIPAKILAAPVPNEPDAVRQLVARAAAALGVATVADLADYYRLPAAATRRAVAELTDDGTLVPVTVPGWPAAWRHHRLVIPRSVHTDALLVPFDPLIWHRERVARLFGMRYRIEIYVPAARREFGYYVLPFLQDDALAARVDLKADRARGVLRVQSTWAHDADAETPGRLASALSALGSWLGVPEVEVADRGDLATSLRRQVSVG